jgi:hypothetical protein
MRQSATRQKKKKSYHLSRQYHYRYNNCGIMALMLPQEVKFAAPMPKLSKFQTMPQLIDENKKR